MCSLFDYFVVCFNCFALPIRVIFFLKKIIWLRTKKWAHIFNFGLILFCLFFFLFIKFFIYCFIFLQEKKQVNMCLGYAFIFYAVLKLYIFFLHLGLFIIWFYDRFISNNLLVCVFVFVWVYILLCFFLSSDKILFCIQNECYQIISFVLFVYPFHFLHF